MLPLVSSCKRDAYVPFVVQIMLRSWVAFFRQMRQIDSKYSTCYCCIQWIWNMYWNLETVVISMCYYFEFFMDTIILGSYCSMFYWRRLMAYQVEKCSRLFFAFKISCWSFSVCNMLYFNLSVKMAKLLHFLCFWLSIITLYWRKQIM
jgi:hypothetical protein